MLEENKIYNKDCISGMEELDDESIALTVTSPPYALNKEYDDDYDDSNENFQEWVSLIEELFYQLQRVTVDGGKVAINIGSSFNSDPYSIQPLNWYIMREAIHQDFSIISEIIWNKGRTGTPFLGTYPYPTDCYTAFNHEYIQVFRKGGIRRISDEERREDSRLMRSELGGLHSIWNIKARGTNKEAGHEAVFPVEIPERLIKYFSFRDDLILDPFMGTGTTAVAAKKLNRDYVGFELKSDWAEFSRNRVKTVEPLSNHSAVQW